MFNFCTVQFLAPAGILLNKAFIYLFIYLFIHSFIYLIFNIYLY